MKIRTLILIAGAWLLSVNANAAIIPSPFLDMDGTLTVQSGSLTLNATILGIESDTDPYIDIPDELFTVSAGYTTAYGGGYLGSYDAGSFGAGDVFISFSNGLINGQTNQGHTLGGSLSGNNSYSGIGDISDAAFILKMGSVTSVPVPAALPLFSAALLGLVGLVRRKI